jgi:hypothetical protein
LPLAELGHCLRELGHVGAGVGEVEVAAVLGRARVLRALLREVLELRAGLELGDDRLGLVFLLDQDMAGAVLGAARLRLELVVFGLDLGVADRRLLVDVGGEQPIRMLWRACSICCLKSAETPRPRRSASWTRISSVTTLSRTSFSMSGGSCWPRAAACFCTWAMTASARAFGTGLPLTTAMFWAWAASGASPVAATAATTMLAARKRFFMMTGAFRA